MAIETTTVKPQSTPKNTTSIGSKIILGLLLLVLGALWIGRQDISDWWRLRGYTPSPAVVSLAQDTTMTPYATRLLYVNDPGLADASEFTKHCPKSAEKTVVLGCYIGNDGGIWLYNVTDQRLNGVVQVTAAHEMLHAAYDRLSSDERRRVDRLLNEYYTSSLDDKRVKDTIDSYRQTEPTELANEMHSIFATEVGLLPDDLETYYKQYFTDRGKVVELTQRYQAEFTSRQQQVIQYDKQLSELKITIDKGKTSLESQKLTLDSMQDAMDRLRSDGDIVAYNNLVPAYNSGINTYNRVLEQTRAQISEYNRLVDLRNAVSVEERQLTQALSASDLPGR